MWVLCGAQCLWCHIVWWAGWGQGHHSTRRCTNTGSIVHPGSWVLVAGDTNIPTFISCCENEPVSSSQIYSHKYHWSLSMTFHPILHWSRLEGVKNFVSPSHDRGIKHSWQEPEGKHQNILFQLKNSLPFQYEITLICYPSCLPSYCFMSTFMTFILFYLGSGHMWIMIVQENSSSRKGQ